MTDADFENEMARIRKFYDKWAGILGLGYYSIERIYERERWDEDHDTAARTTGSWQYRLAHIRFFLPATRENDDEQLEHIVLHEICHIFLLSVAQAVPEDHEHHIEYSTENMCRALEDAYRAGQKDLN